MKIISASILIVFLSFRLSSAQFQYTSPLPGSKMLGINHNIVLREGSLLDASTITKNLFEITGSKSGSHDFRLTVSSDSKTVILSPETPYSYSEEVTVKINEGIKKQNGAEVSAYTFSFNTIREYTTAELLRIKSTHKILEDQELIANGIDTANSVDEDLRDIAGSFEILVNNNPAPGEIFYDVHTGNHVPSVLRGYNIISNDGDSIFSSASHDVYGDFKITNGGKLAVYNDYKVRQDVLDSDFNLIDSFYAANDYEVDSHDFLLLPDGHAILIAIETAILDLTIYDSTYNSEASTEWSVIQEFDENKNLVFEWRSIDHVIPTEAKHEKLFLSYIDLVHTNSIQIDDDGNILCSHRHLDQITKIDRNTGEFIWRMGGINNQFTFIDEAEPYTYQHDARRIANGNITVFDNGNYHSVKHSVAKEYAVDEVNKTATLVWYFNLPGTLPSGWAYFYAAGSVQRLDNGNTFINGGYDSPDYSSNFWEVTPDDSIVWELDFSETNQLIAYRARKYNWDPLYDTEITVEKMKLSIKVYPNPTGDFLYIQAFSKTKQQAEISIFDITGSMVTSGMYHLNTGNNIQTIDLNNISKGIYTLRVTMNTGTGITKFIKN